MNPKPIITISIVSHQNAQEIIGLINSIVKHETITHLQIIITDNLNSDLSDMQFPHCHVLHNEHPQGFAHNHNAAFHHAQGDYFCILNPDIVFIDALFDKLIARIENGDGDIVAPLVIDSKGQVQDSFRSLPTITELIRRRLGRQKTMTSLPPDVDAIFPDWIAGMFLLMKAETFRQLGGFDEKFFLYFEDVDFCTRARLQGYSLLVDASVKVQHDAHRSSRKSIKYLFWHLQSAYRFFMSPVYRQAKALNK